MMQRRLRSSLRDAGVPISAALLGMALVCVPARGQVLQSSPAQTIPGASSARPSPLGGDRAEPPSPLAGMNASRLEHLREDDRHKRIVADTARLVTLTNELKEFVDKASKDQLSLDVVRKAAEIEKLAHDVKERMKG